MKFEIILQGRCDYGICERIFSMPEHGGFHVINIIQHDYPHVTVEQIEERVIHLDRFTVQLPTEMAKRTGYFNEDTKLYVDIPALGLNRFAKSVMECKGDSYTLFYEIDTNQLLAQWEKDGFPWWWLHPDNEPLRNKKGNIVRRRIVTR